MLCICQLSFLSRAALKRFRILHERFHFDGGETHRVLKAPRNPGRIPFLADFA